MLSELQTKTRLFFFMFLVSSGESLNQAEIMKLFKPLPS